MTDTNGPRKVPDPDRLKSRMASLCARSEQCSFDITQKLRKGGLSETAASSIIEELKAMGFIDNVRFARSLARDKVRFSGWGRNRIRLHLSMRRIPSTIIDEALADIDQRDYKEALVRVTKAKARQLDLRDYADRQKLVRHLVSRGFETSLAVRITQALLKRLGQ